MKISIPPLAERDGQLINNWYIASLSSEVRARPIRRVIYDKPIVLFRKVSGEAVALIDRCAHRGAKLSEGCLDNDSIRCPYHGWAYNDQGRVIDIPSEGPGECHSKAVVKAFPICEQDGAVWIWMGEGQPNPLRPPWRFPFIGEKHWSHYFMITDFPNEVTHLAENFMDVPHTVYVHKGWFRNRKLRRVPMKVQAQNGEVLVTYDQPHDEIGFTRLLMNPTNSKMIHTDCFIFPNLTRVDYKFGDASHFVINSQITPVSTLKSRVYTYIGYRILNYGKLLKPLMRFYTRRVIEQDVDIMLNQSENLQYFWHDPFQSTAADDVHLAIERLRRMGQLGSDQVWNTSKTSEREFWI